jgi:hypothetical protein
LIQFFQSGLTAFSGISCFVLIQVIATGMWGDAAYGKVHLLASLNPSKFIIVLLFRTGMLASCHILTIVKTLDKPQHFVKIF